MASQTLASEPPAATLERLGAQFEAYRISRNLTQEDLAKAAGLSKNTVINLEKTGAGTLDSVLRVLDALDLKDRLFLLVPDTKVSPLDPLGGQRQRASRNKKKPVRTVRWGDEQ